MNFLVSFISLLLDTWILLGKGLVSLSQLIGFFCINLLGLVFSLFQSIGQIVLTVFARKKISPKKKKQNTSLVAFWNSLKLVALGIIIAGFVFLLYQTYTFVEKLPDPSLIGVVNYPVSTKLYDRNGILLYEIYHDQNRTPVSIDSIPSYVKQATIAIEDKDFYSHQGISLFGGIGRAIKDSFLTGNLQGGSTITQQLVKTALLSPERTVIRKVREICIALWTEKIYSKKQILEMYLNQVPYGGSAYGIEQASQTYFGKSAHVLSLDEAAFLAGLPKAPSYYSPYVNPTLARRRRDEVLEVMKEENYISANQYAEAVKKDLKVNAPNVYIKAPHFVFYVKALLEKMYGVRRVEEGGLSVITSLDSSLQATLEDQVKQEVAKLSAYDVDNAAALVTVPSTGEILAMIGSRDYYLEPYGAYNVTTAERQPGSSIKPIMYALALEQGYTAATILDDSPVTYSPAGSKPYSPVNYDGQYHGKVPLRYALGNSYNIPAVRTLNSLGVGNFIIHAQKMGISTWNDPSRYGLSITLGGGEVKMTDMATAYGVFANGGEKEELEPIWSVQDYKGRVLFSREDMREQVLDRRIAFIINSILSDNDARKSSFGPSSLLVIPNHTVAVKTGTSNNKRDNWTIGYTNKFLAAVWVGNHDNRPMNPALTSGVTGAAPIWHGIMTTLLDSYDDKKITSNVVDSFTMPEGMIQKPCYGSKMEYFIEEPDMSTSCRSEIKVEDSE